MHELALTESIVAGVSERMGGARVTRVILEIGRLSGVASEAIRFCFDICTRGTNLEGAELDISEPPGIARCKQCGTDTATGDFLVSCPCGSSELELVSGQQFLVKAVEVI